MDEAFAKAYRAGSYDPNAQATDFANERNTLMSAPASTDAYTSANVRTGALGAQMLAEGLDNSSTYTYFNRNRIGARKTGRSTQKPNVMKRSNTESGGALLFTAPSNQANHLDAGQPPPSFALPAHQFAASSNTVKETKDWATSNREGGSRDHNNNQSLATGSWTVATAPSMLATRSSGSFSQYPDVPGGGQNYDHASYPTRNQGGKLPPPVPMGFPGSSNANSGNLLQNMPTSILFNLHRAHQHVHRTTTRGGSASDWGGSGVVQVDQKFADRRRKPMRSYSVDDGRAAVQDSASDVGDSYHHIHHPQRSSFNAVEPVSGVATNIGRIVSGGGGSGGGGGGAVSMVMHGSKVKASRQTSLNTKKNSAVGRSPLQRQTLVGTSIHKWPSIGAGGRRGGSKRRQRRGQIRKGGVRR